MAAIGLSPEPGFQSSDAVIGDGQPERWASSSAVASTSAAMWMTRWRAGLRLLPSRWA